jgi:hypothetical protein
VGSEANMKEAINNFNNMYIATF